MTSISINVFKDQDVASIIQRLKFLKDKKILDYDLNPTDFLIEGEKFTEKSIREQIANAEKSKPLSFEQAKALLKR